MPRKAKAAEPKRESSLHWHVAHLLDNFLACPPCFYTTFPAGGGGEMRGMILKGLGLKSGVPDILIIYGVDPIPPTIRQLVIAAAAAYPEWPVAQQALYELQTVALSPAAHWIELKRQKSGVLSTVQIETQEALAACGCKIANCVDMDQVKAVLDAWALPRYSEKPRLFNERIALTNINERLKENKPIDFSALENLSDFA